MRYYCFENKSYAGLPEVPIRLGTHQLQEPQISTSSTRDLFAICYFPYKISRGFFYSSLITRTNDVSDYDDFSVVRLRFCLQNGHRCYLLTAADRTALAHTMHSLKRCKEIMASTDKIEARFQVSYCRFLNCHPSLEARLVKHLFYIRALRKCPCASSHRYLPAMIGEPKLLLGKVAAITGGLTGIGRAIAIGFIKHGCKVAIGHLGGSDEDKALKAMHSEVASHTTNFINVPGDISMPETGGILIDAVVKRWGRLDIFISNAGICQFVEFLEYFLVPSAVVSSSKHRIV